MKRICKQCGKEFELSKREMQFYKTRHLSLPRRCRECRGKNRGEEELGSVSETQEKPAVLEMPQDEKGEKKKAANKVRSQKGGNEKKQENGKKAENAGNNQNCRKKNKTADVKAAGSNKSSGNSKTNQNGGGNGKTNQKGMNHNKTGPKSGGKNKSSRTGRYAGNAGNDRMNRYEKIPQNNRKNRNGGNYGNSRRGGNYRSRSGASSRWLRVLIGLAAVLLLLTAAAAAGWSSLSSSQTEIPRVRVETLGFRTDQLLEEHYEKHGMEMGFDTAEEYETAAARIVEDSRSLHKREADGDDVYYLEETNELVIVSTDGYIRTYFEPEDGIEYYERQ